MQHNFNEIIKITKELFKSELENINIEKEEETIIVNSYNKKTYIISIPIGNKTWDITTTENITENDIYVNNFNLMICKK